MAQRARPADAVEPPALAGSGTSCLRASMKRLGPEPLIDRTAKVQQSRLGRYTEVGARTSLVETELGDYSYVVNDSDIVYTRVGKFCSIAAGVRINPGNHPMWRGSQSHLTYPPSPPFFSGEEQAGSFC